MSKRTINSYSQIIGISKSIEVILKSAYHNLGWNELVQCLVNEGLCDCNVGDRDFSTGDCWLRRVSLRVVLLSERLC